MEFRHLLVFLLGCVNVSGLNEILRGESVLYGLTTIVQTNSNSTPCLQELEQLYKAIEAKQVWSLKALDASGVPDDGFIYGNNLWIGSHAQCNDISNRKRFEINYEKVERPPPTPFDYPPYDMNFYMFLMEHNNTLQFHSQLPLEFTIQLGLCLPASCTIQDLIPLFIDYIDSNSLNIQNLFNLKLNLIEIKPLKRTGLWMLQLPKTIILICLTLFLIILTIIGTIYDVRRHNRMKNMLKVHRGIFNSKQNPTSVYEVELVASQSVEDLTKPSVFGEIIQCFSFYSNAKNSMRTKLSGDTIRSIHGLRFLGMLWVILAHSVFYQMNFIDNVATVYRLSEDIPAQVLSNSTYCVDTYLFLSGFLVAYLNLKSKLKNYDDDETKSINYTKKIREFFLMILKRFLRLTPVYVFIILFTDVFYTYYQQTSSLITSERNDLHCSKYWWRNLLYINNLFPRSEMCLSWSWYLSVDMQFFVLAAFLLILSTITIKITGILVVLLLFTTIIATIYKSYSIGYIPSMDEQFAQMDAIYDLPWNRLGPYLIGVITAYLLLVKLKKKLIIRERTRILLWILFPLLNLWILFTLYGRNLSVEFSAFYMGVSRTLWGIGIGWILIACCTGNASTGLLEKFLSFRGWIPMSRLTYCAYLINPAIITMISLGAEHRANASVSSFAVVATGIMLISFFIALLLYTLIEAPFELLRKMLFQKLFIREKQETSNN